jgi:hypothetical protein
MKKHARDMTEAEFAEANRAKAWRTPIAKTPASSSSSTPPPPGDAPAPKAALQMTDAEFEIANRNKDWRKGVTSR